MVQNKKDEDSLNILIGFILIVFVALALLWALSGIRSCPEGTFSCDSSISSCGCCVNDAHGNPIESCGFGVCPEGYHHNELRGCCSNTNIFDCLPNYAYCRGTLIPCGDISCCAPDKCVEGPDEIYKCVPCSVNSVCDPSDVNSCCDGYACDGVTSTCRRLDSCKGLTCTNYNELCMICGTDGSDCLNCEDNSVCVFDSKLGTGTCKSTASCLGNSCSFPGQQCSYSPTLPCPEICANVGGTLTCVSTGGCPSGTWACNLPGCSCCSIDTGACVSCLNNPCSSEQEGQHCSYCDPSGICTSCPDSICKNGVCIPKDDYFEVTCLSPYSIIDGVCKLSETEPPPPEFPPCKSGYVYNEELGLCVSDKPVFCNNPSCTTNLDGDYCREFVDEFNVKLCTSRCVEQTDSSFTCVVPGTNGEDINGNDFDENDIPNWLLNLQVSCIEYCEDCPRCSEVNEDYDLNNDGYLNIKDLEIFYEYYNTIQDSIPVKVISDNEMFDFNNDGYIDEDDEACILGRCVGDCRIIGIEDLGICVTAEYYDHSFTSEQKAAISNYDLLFNNIVNVPNVFDCSYVKSRNKPFCNSLKTHFEHSSNNILLLRELEYVFLERNNLGYFYSSCAFMKNNEFAMYLSPNECSNEVNVYFSNDVLYYIMGHGMAAFNNCVKNLPDQTYGTDTYKGNCNTFKENVVDTCLGNFKLGTNKITNEYCIEHCTGLTSEEWNIIGECDAWLDNKDIVNACLGIPSPETCSSAQLERTVFCIQKGRCPECEKCTDIGNRIFNLCANQYQVSSVPYLINRFEKQNYFDVCLVTGLGSAGCGLYGECFERFSDLEFCKKLVIESYWVNDGNQYSKQLYCWSDTTIYDYHMYDRFALYTESIVEQTILSNKFTEVKPLFSGFMKKCPDGVLCSLAPHLCVNFGGGLELSHDFYIDGVPGSLFDDIVNKPGNYAPDKGVGRFGPGKAGPGLSTQIQQGMIQGGGLDTVINPGGGTTGGGFGP